MKNAVILGFLLIATHWAFGQNANDPEKPLKSVEETEIGCIIWPAELPKAVPMVFNADSFYRTQIVQPFFAQDDASKRNLCRISSYSKGVLDEDLPFVHTLTGSVFTFDYLRPSVR